MAYFCLWWYGIFFYHVAASLLNNTVLTVDKSQSTVKVEHLPFSLGYPTQTLSTLHIVLVRCRCNILYHENGTITSYDLRLVDQNSIDNVVMTELPNLEEAIYLAQELGDFLGLQTADCTHPFSCCH
jgi:hypothetical protein